MPGNLPNAPPPAVIASWPKPNYDDPVTRNWLPAYAIVMHLLSTVLVSLRYIIRYQREAGGFGLDDALLLPAWLGAMGFTALAMWSSEYGLIDRHFWDVSPSKYVGSALNAWIGEFVFVLGTCTLKLSILLFYRRLQSGTYSRPWLLAIYAALTFTALYSLALLLALIFACMPTDAYWMVWRPGWQDAHSFHCGDTAPLNLISGVFSIFSDVYAIALPFIMLHGLQMSFRKKVGLNAVFAVSVSIVIAGIGRTYEFHELSTAWDQTWTGFWVYFWSILEYQLGIICACLPTLSVFVKKRWTIWKERPQRSKSQATISTPLTTTRDGVPDSPVESNDRKDLEAGEELNWMLSRGVPAFPGQGARVYNPNY